jgi:hypothetical protein
MYERYRRLGAGLPWHGAYEGLGRNDRSYVLPRIYSGADSQESGLVLPFSDLIRSYEPGTLDEGELLELCTATIPSDELIKLERCVSDAKNLAEQGLAAPFPEKEEERRHLRLFQIASWLHSRDIERLMTALGYRLPATGVHDIDERVAGGQVKTAIERCCKVGMRYSDWLLRWVNSLEDDASVNIGCLNPALVVCMWQWTPEAPRQDAMDVHRISSHHSGDGEERYDPIEAAVNNVLHQREGRFGIRKESTVGWRHMLLSIERDSEAEALGKSSISRQALRDALHAAIDLEQSGGLTPWGLAKLASFEN